MIRHLGILAAALTLTVGAALAEHGMVERARIRGPRGAVDGKLVTVGNYMVLVDDENPDLSFSIPREDVRSVDRVGDTLVIRTARPFVDRFGQRSELRLELRDSSAHPLMGWTGAPSGTIGAWTGEASRSASPLDLSLDVKLHDDYGRLTFGPGRIDFDNIKHPGRSRSWNYSQIEKFEWKDSGRKVEIEPYDSDEYEFEVKNGRMTESSRDLVLSRIPRKR